MAKQIVGYDIVVGMGEMGSALYELLEKRHIRVEGYDKDPAKYRAHVPPGVLFDIVHICIPYSDTFVKDVADYIDQFAPRMAIIHSTVRVGTTAAVSQLIEGKIPVFYSPIRGVHERFLMDLQTYEKYISPMYAQYEKMLIDRFSNIVWVGSPESLELTKLMETTYYGYLIAFRKDIDKKFTDMSLEPYVFWDFCKEIHERLGNRPIMYNDGEPIGGHCVIPNLELLPESFDFYKNLVGKWSQKD